MAEPSHRLGELVIRGLRRPGQGEEAGRVAGLVRGRFALPEGSVIVASELRCAVPGCPPVETAVLIWDEVGTRYRLKVFRPLAEVTEADLPPRWYLPAMVDDGEADCGCC